MTRSKWCSPSALKTTLRVDRWNSVLPTIRSSCVTRLVMTEGTRSSFCAAALKLPVFATATKARIEAIVSILHDSRKLNRRQAPFSVELARLASEQGCSTGFRFCGHQAKSDKEKQCTISGFSRLL